MTTNRIYISLSNILLILFVMISISCKKENDASGTLSTNGKSKLIFSVQGINNTVAKESKLNKDRTLVNSNLVSSISSAMRLDNNISILSKGSIETRKTLFENNDGSSKIKTKLLASSRSLHDDTRYRILLYNITTGAFEESLETSAGGIAEIEVDVNSDYRWYAYSFNAKDPIEAPIFENNEPIIRTVEGKEFIWASSNQVISPTLERHPISITFDHKVAEVILEIDQRNLYGKITELDVEFLNPEYFNTAKINLLTGDASSIQTYTVPPLSLSDFKYDDQSDPTTLRAVFYTAQPSGFIDDLTLNIKKASILHDDGTLREVHRITDPIKTVTFDFENSSSSVSHIASMIMRYKISQKTVLHVTGAHELHNWHITKAHAAQPASMPWSSDPDANRSPFNMLKAQRNYGLLENSIVYTDGFDHLVCGNDGTLDQKLALNPDIVIIALFYQMDGNDMIALKNYLDNGGVVIMMTDTFEYPSAINNDMTSTQAFFRLFFNKNDITVTEHQHYGHSTLFEFISPMSPNKILDGPFEGLHGRHWLSDAADNRDLHTAQASELPVGDGVNEVTLYCNSQATNASITPIRGHVMFKHNSKDLFWIGDGTFLNSSANRRSGWTLASSGAYATGISGDGEPFSTVSNTQPNPNTEFNYEHYPMPKAAGYNYSANPNIDPVGVQYGAVTYNTPFFANLMAWALYRSEFFGINKTN